MYSLPTAPKTIGGVLDDIFKLYAAVLPVCWPIALTRGLLIVIPSVFLALQLGSDPTTIMAGFTSPVFWICYVALIIISVVFSIAVLVRALDVAEGRDGSFAAAISRGFVLFPRTFLASFLYGLAVGFGMVLLVVPGLYLLVSLCLSGVIIVAEDIPALDSLSRSRALIKGDWWRTAAVLSIALIVAYLLLICVGVVAGFIGGFMGANLMVTTVVQNIVTALLNVVITPLYASTILGVYFDLKLRKEGGDLAHRVAALGQA